MKVTTMLAIGMVCATVVYALTKLAKVNITHVHNDDYDEYGDYDDECYDEDCDCDDDCDDDCEDDCADDCEDCDCEDCDHNCKTCDR